MADMELIRVIALEDEASAPDDGQYLLTDAADGTKKMKAVKLLQNEAQTFDTSANYAAGDYVLYNGRLYCFTAAHAAGAWTGEDADAVTIGNLLEGLDNDIADIQTALETKAEIDGYYEKMTVGDAEQIISTVLIEDQDPYLFRQTGNNKGVGNRDYTTIVGASVVENQLIQYPTSGTTYGGVTFTVNNNVIELSGTANASWINCFGSHTTKANHVYLIDTTKIADPNNTNITIGSLNSYINTTIGTSKMFKPSGSVYDGLGVQSYGGSGTDLSGIKFSAKIIDLSIYLPANIVDYAYALESATAGSGIAWLRSYGFLGGYVPYNAGSIESVEVTEKKCVGFNQWDEEVVNGYWDVSTGEYTPSATWMASKNHIPVLPNTQYYIKGDESKTSSFGAYVFYDANKNYISGSNANHKNTIFTTPANCHYMTFYANTVYNGTDICINLSNPDRNGEYEPYTATSYPLGNDTLRGIFKLDANNKLYADGDRKEADGTITRRYPMVDLGTLNWQKSSNGNKFYATANPTYAFRDDLQMICSAYAFDGVGNSARGYYGDNKTLRYFYADGTVTTELYVHDESYSDAASFKTAMSGQYLVYEAATPSTETSTPFTSPQIVYPDGTEEFITENGLPVGHNTKYTANLRAKLEMAPDSPDGDGDYIVRQTNGENTYVPLVIPVELPAAPSVDGTYVLKATVSGGAVTYSWIAE